MAFKSESEMAAPETLAGVVDGFKKWISNAVIPHSAARTGFGGKFCKKYRQKSFSCFDY
jgi:hypothetical protein